MNGNLTLVDNIIGRLMDGLLQRKLDKCINIIIVADHGKNLHTVHIAGQFLKDGIYLLTYLVPPPRDYYYNALLFTPNGKVPHGY